MPTYGVAVVRSKENVISLKSCHLPGHPIENSRLAVPSLNLLLRVVWVSGPGGHAFLAARDGTRMASSRCRRRYRLLRFSWNACCLVSRFSRNACRQVLQRSRCLPSCFRKQQRRRRRYSSTLMRCHLAAASLLDVLEGKLHFLGLEARPQRQRHHGAHVDWQTNASTWPSSQGRPTWPPAGKVRVWRSCRTMLSITLDSLDRWELCTTTGV